MKFLRIFEDYNDGNYTGEWYWLVPTDERFNQSLIDIGCKEESFMTSDFTDVGDYIYVSYNYGWQFMDYNDDSVDYYERNGRKYMGSVNLTKDELENLEIMKKQTKYNL